MLNSLLNIMLLNIYNEIGQIGSRAQIGRELRNAECRMNYDSTRFSI